MRRGEIWWASLPEPAGSGPGYRRPVVIVQANSFNESRIQTAIVAVITSNLRLVEAPGNVLITASRTGLRKDSVINVSQLITVDKAFLTERVGRLNPSQSRALDAGLKLVLAL
jgi:mRNA interferase MazF